VFFTLMPETVVSLYGNTGAATASLRADLEDPRGILYSMRIEPDGGLTIRRR
jgi:hypothetical protein